MANPGKKLLRRRALGLAMIAITAAAGIGVVLTRGPSLAAEMQTTSATQAITINSGACTGGGTEFCFAPETVSIATGTTVTWTNMSLAPHALDPCTAMACSGAPANTGTQSFNVSISSSNGSTGSFTFTSAGTYTYYCTIHGYMAMHGMITVTGGPTPTPTPTPIISAPHIKSFSPTSGKPGISVTINGTHLLHASKVTFNGVTAAVKSDAGRKIVAVVPAGATTGKIAVTTGGGTAMSATNFTVT